MTDFYDGPRGGVADFDGRPHVYKAEQDYNVDDSPSVFFLSPISEEALQLALEKWAIWRRWETAFYQGKAPQGTHPALPEERARHDELKKILSGQLVIDPERQIRARGKFRRRDDPNWSGFGTFPLEVQWEPC